MATQHAPSTFVPEAELPVLELARTPRLAGRLSALLFVTLLAFPFVLALVPWTQSVHGGGRAIAFNPVQRPQFIVSPIEGRVKKWHVVEGQRVKSGERIVEMVDNDPDLERRLVDEERATLERLRAAEGRVRDIEARLVNLRSSRDLALSVQQGILRQEEAKLQGFEQDVLEAEAALAAAEPNFRRVKELYENPLGGLASQRDLEVAEQALQTALAKRKAAQARVRLGTEAVRTANDNLAKVDADTKAIINLESAVRGSAQGDVAAVLRDKAQIEVRIARQRAQYVDAPTDGVVYRLLANAEQGGLLVKPGERLAVLVPDIKPGPAGRPTPAAAAAVVGLAGSASPLPAAPLAAPAPAAPALTDGGQPGIVVELFIDGNDLPLVEKGDAVRLQFEGWPAVQFVGWPSVAVGTFGGRVHLVDPTANEKGLFRLLVEPDPDDAPWPDQRYLRQGVRAQGWVLLNEVSIGWEIWRQLNGFPPARDYQAGKDGSGGPVKTKVRK